MTSVLGTLPSGALRPTVASYQFGPFRQYRILSRRLQAEVLEAEVGAVFEKSGAIALAEEDAEQAVAVFRPLPWDSEFFGISMGQIDYLLRTEAAGRSLLAEALLACHENFRARGVRHVTVRVDVADTLAIAVLEEQGYRLMDALVTYIYHPRREAPAGHREMGVLRDFRPGDAAQIVEIAAEAYRGFRGRFHLDPHLPDARCDEFYVEWARQCCGGEMADQVFITENTDGLMHGFLAFRRREPVSTVGGVAIYGGGLGACRRGAPGAYAGLIRAGTVWAHARGGVAECQTQNYNFSTIRVYEAVGSRYTRADYTFHAWLGD